jgi:hypothetical protein
MVLVIIGYRYYDTWDIMEDGKFYRNIREFKALEHRGKDKESKKKGSLVVSNK